MTLRTSLAALFLACTPLAAAAQMMPPPPTTAAMPFLAMAGEADLYEIRSSEIALRQSRDADVRRFARMLIAHHTQTSRDAMRAARAARIAPPRPMLGPAKREMIAELMAAGPRFDRVYLRQQVMAHEEALALHRTYAARGDRPQLRRAASATVPIVTRHLAEARRLVRTER